MKNRQNGKDIAKAIGIYLVITGHLLSAQAQAGHALIYLVHMPLFFWISGYFLYGSVKKHSIAENVRNKVDTLLIPFLVWSGVALLANLAVSFLNGSLGLQVICSGFYEVYIQARSMWFLLILFLAQMLVLLLHRITSKYSIKLEIGMMLITWLILIGLLPDQLFSLDKFKWMFPYLILGYGMHAMDFFREKQKSLSSDKSIVTGLLQIKKEGGISAGIIGVVCSTVYILVTLKLYEYPYMQAFLAKKSGGMNDFLPYSLIFLLSLLGVLGLMKLSEGLSESRIGSILAGVGRYSMDIYVIHMFFIKFVTYVPAYAQKSAIAYNCGFVPFYALGVVGVVYLMAAFLLRRIGVYCRMMGINRK